MGDSNTGGNVEPEDLSEEPRAAPIVLASIAGAIIGVAVWGGVTAATGYQFDWLAIVVGVFVGAAVRFSGKTVPAGVRLAPPILIAAGLFVGNLLMLSILAAQKSNVPFGRVLADLPLDGPQLLVDGFQPLDVLYYVLALAAGLVLALVRRR